MKVVGENDRSKLVTDAISAERTMRRITSGRSARNKQSKSSAVNKLVDRLVLQDRFDTSSYLGFVVQLVIFLKSLPTPFLLAGVDIGKEVREDNCAMLKFESVFVVEMR